MVLCTIDVIGFYYNILHSVDLASLWRFLELRGKKRVSTDTPIELAERVLKNNIVEFDEKAFKQLR